MSRATMWVARIIAFVAFAFFLIYAFSAWTFSEGLGSDEEARFLTAAAVVALVGFLVSWWRARLAGLLMIVAWLITLTMAGYLGIAVYTSPVSRYWFLHKVLGFILIGGSPALITGILFILSWRLSRKTGP